MVEKVRAVTINRHRCNWARGWTRRAVMNKLGMGRCPSINVERSNEGEPCPFICH